MTGPQGPGSRPGRVPGPGPWLDAATVAAVWGAAVANREWLGIGNEEVGWYVQLALALPLLARRRFPAETFAVAAAATVAQFLASGVPAGELVLLVALYSVGAHERRRWALIGSGVAALLGGSAAVIAWSPSDEPREILILLAGTVIAAWVTGVYVRTRRAYLRSVLDRAATAERERDQQQLTIRAEQRDQLSREIHDIVAHNLSVMIALGDGAAIALDRNPAAARSAIEQASATGRQALEEIRRLLGTLRDRAEPPSAPQPGLADLDDLVARVRAADLPVELAVTGRPRDVPAGAQLAVYRIVQEGLTNVLKHAPTAGAARVEICFDDRDVRITITNDCVPGRQGSQPGHGLTGMRERAAVFDGELEAGPDGPRGWRVRARLVLPAYEVPAW